MRISDWSSDVCSSDLVAVLENAFAKVRPRENHAERIERRPGLDRAAADHAALRKRPRAAAGGRARISNGDAGQIGRASCRERVCQYVSISVVAVSLKKKQ